MNNEYKDIIRDRINEISSQISEAVYQLGSYHGSMVTLDAILGLEKESHSVRELMLTTTSLLKSYIIDYEKGLVILNEPEKEDG